VERTLFNLSHPKTQTDSWAVDPMLFTEKSEDHGFSGQDWDRVPKVAYETALFRKLAPPRMAKVVTNPSSFVLETYGAPRPQLDDHATRSGADSLNEAKGLEQPPLDAEGGKVALSQVLGSQQANTSTTLDAEEDLQEDLGQGEDLTQQRLGDSNPSALEAPLMGSSKDELSSVSRDASAESILGVQGSDELVQDAASSMPQTPSVHSSASFDEGYQLGLLKGIEQAHAEAMEEFEAERRDLQEQIAKALDQSQALQASEVSLQAKIEELTLALEQQRAGLEAERDALRAQNTTALDAQKKLLEEVTSKLDDFVNHPQRLFEPLKRLAIHIAEQLVLAELNLSGASIERLIQRCLDELNSHSNQMVTVELNTQDKARLQEMSGEMFNHIQLHAVSSMQPGSVRVITDDTQVDDLIGHRLEAMANNLLAQPELWREQSPFFKQPLAQRDTDIEDVRQRLAPVVDVHEEDQDD